MTVSTCWVGLYKMWGGGVGLGATCGAGFCWRNTGIKDYKSTTNQLLRSTNAGLGTVATIKRFNHMF